MIISAKILKCTEAAKKYNLCSSAESVVNYYQNPLQLRNLRSRFIRNVSVEFRVHIEARAGFRAVADEVAMTFDGGDRVSSDDVLYEPVHREFLFGGAVILWGTVLYRPDRAVVESDLAEAWRVGHTALVAYPDAVVVESLAVSASFFFRTQCYYLACTTYIPVIPPAFPSVCIDVVVPHLFRGIVHRWRGSRTMDDD
mgnify:CR=1 FL=1